jgi:hypothetical protein
MKFSKKSMTWSARPAREAGRDPATTGIEGRLSWVSQEPQDWLAPMQAWETLGAPHLSVRTGAQRSPQEHIDALRRFKAVMAAGESGPLHLYTRERAAGHAERGSKL